MYMESVGYSVYSGNRIGAAPLSNYKFFCENTKAYVSHPQWVSYNRNTPGSEGVAPSGGANLNIFRYLEIEGPLATPHYKKYRYQVDSSYALGDQVVYSIGFEGKFANGTLHVWADSKQLLKLQCTTLKYWSNAFRKRLEAQVNIQFNYFDNTPFIAHIDAQYTHEGLRYENRLDILVQKFNEFKLDQDQYWSINNYDYNPYIEYSPEKWANWNIAADEDEQKISRDIALDLEQHFQSQSGRWFFPTRQKSELAREFIMKMKDNF
jgi:hypothetical protein